MGDLVGEIDGLIVGDIVGVPVGASVGVNDLHAPSLPGDSNRESDSISLVLNPDLHKLVSLSQPQVPAGEPW